MIPRLTLSIGNVPWTWKPNDLNSDWVVVAAAITRAKARKRGVSKKLKVKEMTPKMDKEKLIKLRKEESKI